MREVKFRGYRVNDTAWAYGDLVHMKGDSGAIETFIQDDGVPLLVDPESVGQLIGIRREESNRRAKRNEVEVSSRKFSENFDQFSEHQEEMVTCVSGKDKILLSPILHWTEDDVWDFLNSNNIPHCELYDQGYHRIGCIMCPMSTMKQKLREMKEYPHVLRKWCQTIEWLDENVWQYNEKIENITLRDRVHWWISGLSLEEFRYKYMSPTLFSSEEMGKDPIEELIKAAFEGYERPTTKTNQ